jgi:hypothetical protein
MRAGAQCHSARGCVWRAWVCTGGASFRLTFLRTVSNATRDATHVPLRPSRTAAPTQRRRTREHGAALHGPPQQSRAATRHGLAQRTRRAARPTQRTAMLGRTSGRLCRQVFQPDLLSTRRGWLTSRWGAWASSLSSHGSGFRPLNNRNSQQASGPSVSQAPSETNWRTEAQQTGSTAGGAQPRHECDDTRRP